jgi:type I restriction enzyme S subunit
MAATGKHPVYGGNGINGYHDTFLFSERKVVIGRVGYYCGSVHFTEPESWITDNALYVAEKDTSLIDEYLVEALRTLDLRKYAGQAAQPLVSGSRIYPLEIPLPPIESQEEFAQRVSEIREFETSQVSNHTRLDALFQSMLHRAFNGNL